MFWEDGIKKFPKKQQNVVVNTLFNNFLGEKETYVLFLLKKAKKPFGHCNSFYYFVCRGNT